MGNELLGLPKKKKQMNNYDQQMIPGPQDTDNSSFGRSQTVSDRLKRLRRKNKSSSQLQSIKQSSTGQQKQIMDPIKNSNDFDPNQLRQQNYRGFIGQNMGKTGEQIALHSLVLSQKPSVYKTAKK